MSGVFIMHNTNVEKGAEGGGVVEKWLLGKKINKYVGKMKETEGE